MPKQNTDITPKVRLKPKSARLDHQPIPIRLDKNSKALIKHAAEASGVTVSHFIRQHVLEAAQRTLGEQYVMKLSLEAAKNFSKSLSSDKPNPKLAKLFKQHQKIAFHLPKE